MEADLKKTLPIDVNEMASQVSNLSFSDCNKVDSDLAIYRLNKIKKLINHRPKRLKKYW